MHYSMFVVVLVMLPCSLWAACPDVKTMSNFDAQKFMGKWYEIQKYPIIFEAGQKCITANYELNPNGTITVTNKSVLRLINYPVSITGIATPDANDPAKLSVAFSQNNSNGKLWVIDTDYTNYALLYSCSTLPVFQTALESAWIMSRTPTLDSNTVNTLKSELSAAKSATSLFIATDQTNCDN